MAWHLKDRELENKLIAIDCKFLTELNETVKEKINEFSSDSLEEGDLITLMFCRDSQIELGKLYFLFSELEEVPEYNPKIWNDYRKVTPPENCVFRAKVYWTSFEGETIVDYDCLIYQYSSWYRVRNCKPFGGRLNITKGEHVEFKAWED